MTLDESSNQHVSFKLGYKTSRHIFSVKQKNSPSGALYVQTT